MTYYTNLLFSDKKLLYQRFLTTDLGELYQAIPFEELAAQIPCPKYDQSAKKEENPGSMLKGTGLNVS